MDDKAIKAFDIKSEEAPLRDSYGRNDLGQSCLLARRLVEAGVTFVAVQAGGGSDTHGDNFKQLKDNLVMQATGLLFPRATQADLQPSTNQEFSWRADLTSPAMHSESVMLSEFLLLAVNLFSPSGSALQHSPSCS